MKIMTIVGTRPEIIRLSRVINLIEKVFEHVLIHTGQNYDYELSQIFFDELNISKPKYFLNISHESLGGDIASIIKETEAVILKENPNALLVLGDTNSALSALIAKRMKIPTFHMEAGNRSFDSNIPEEINRKIIDHLSDFNLVYTEHARRNLLREGIQERFIFLTGSPMYEVIDFYKEEISKSVILNELKIKKNKYFVLSIHREENIENPINFKTIIQSINYIYEHYKIPIIISTHPRTRKKLSYYDSINTLDEIKFLNPFGFVDYLHLQLNAFCTLSDSGSLSEESSILNFPAVSLRKSTERPEALDAGNIVLTDFNQDSIIKAIEISRYLKNSQSSKMPAEYFISNTSERVVKILSWASKLRNKWFNMDNFNRYDFS